MFPKIKLTYFDLDARGSAVRAALHVAGIPFEDERIPFDETFQRIRDKFPFGKVPVLQVDGESIAESQAMLRFVGRLGGLYPVNNPELALLVDEILAAYDDVIACLAPSRRERDPLTRKRMRDELVTGRLQELLRQIDRRLQLIEGVRLQQGAQAPERDVLIHEILVWDYVRMFRSDFIDHREAIPGFFSKLDQRIAARGAPFATGASLTIADLAIYGVIGFLRHGELPHVSPKVVDQFSHLVAIYDKVAMLPKVQEWNATRQSK
ncbi:hypothetical protein ATCC90586_002213 [Pythium insidiosum]|nr:hypothetical protein ATCC90586_002213 [Pythium insidiosum]